MTTPPAASAPDTPSPSPLENTRAKYEALYNSLDDAYYSGKDTAAKAEIQKQKDAAYKILTVITQAQLDQDTSQLSALKNTVHATNVSLKKLQDDIKGIVKDVQVAGDVEEAISGVLGVAAFFV